MKWARYGPEKKQISALHYNEAKHGEVYCRFCNGKMTYVAPENRAPHFRVVDRKSHTCKYFGNDIEDLVSICSDAVKLDRRINESPLFILNMESLKTTGYDSNNMEDHKPMDLSITSIRYKGSRKEKAIYKFIQDLHDKFLKNDFERVLRFRFIVEESGARRKLKAEELIPNYKQIAQLDLHNTLGARRRFIVGTILSAKETIKRNIEVTLRGEKKGDGTYINHKIIFMKNVLEQLNLHIADFYQGRSLVVYAKLKMSESKREVISFVSNDEDFDFGRYTCLDGDWVDSQEKKTVDDFFYLSNITHIVPNYEISKQYFQFNGSIHKPDWVLFLRDKTVVVDYTHSPNDYIHGPLAQRRDYFINHTTYMYMSIYREDLEVNLKELKRKLLELQPTLQLNLYES